MVFEWTICISPLFILSCVWIGRFLSQGCLNQCPKLSRVISFMFKLVRNGIKVLLVASTTQANWRIEDERSQKKLEPCTQFAPLETPFRALWIFNAKEIKSWVELYILFYLNGANQGVKKRFASIRPLCIGMARGINTNMPVDTTLKGEGICVCLCSWVKVQDWICAQYINFHGHKKVSHVPVYP